jgi:hypothetical protein
MGRAFGVEEKHIRAIIEHLDNLPRGAIVCTAELKDCREMWAGARAGLPGAVCIDRVNQYWSPNWLCITDEFLFGDWRPGRYAWELDDVRVMATPVPIRGMQGLWKWEEEGK